MGNHDKFMCGIPRPHMDILDKYSLYVFLMNNLDSSTQLEWPAMGWLRLVGSLKLQVSFAKEPY